MIIDIHAHCSQGLAWLSYDPLNDKYLRFITAQEFLKKMDEYEISLATILPLSSPESSIEQITTREVINICKTYADRLIPFCNPDPRVNMGSKKALSLVLEEYKREGCKGVGEITANIPFDDERALSLFEISERLELPVLFHIGPQLGGCYGLVDEIGLPRLEKCLKMFPNLIFIGHSQPFWAEISGDLKPEERNSYPPGRVAPGGKVLELLRNYPNLYADLSAGSGYNAISRDSAFGVYFLEEFQDKLLFGTDLDYPTQDIPQLKYLINLMEERKISKRAFEKIMWKNAKGLLKLNV